MSPSLKVLAPMILVLFASVAGLVAMLSEYRITREQMLLSEMDNLQDISQLLQGASENLLRHGNENGVRAQLSSLTTDPKIISATIATPDNRIRFASSHDLAGKLLSDVLPFVPASLIDKVKQNRTTVSHQDKNNAFMVMLSPVLLPAEAEGLRDYQTGVIAIHVDLGFIARETQFRLTDIAIKYFSVLLIMVLVFSLMYHLFVTRRISVLLKATQRLAEGDLSARSHLQGSDEIGRIGQSFDAMSEALEEDQKALRYSEDVLRRSQSAANIGSWEWLIKEDKIFWSENTYDMFGLPANGEPLNLDKFSALLHPDDKLLVENAIQKSFKEKTPYEVTHRLIMPDGKVKWFHEIGEVLYDSSGQPVKMTGVARDITHQHELEESQKLLQNQLIQAQKMESIGHLTAGLAHDFNNILASILGYAELAKERYSSLDSSGKLSTYLNQIVESGDRAAGLVSQMLSFSRGESADMQVCQPDQVIQESLAMLSSTIPSSINLRYELSGCDCMIRIDSVQMHQVIMNLVINARDALPEQKGDIIIGTDIRDCSECICQSCYEPIAGQYCVIYVKDNGSGIDQETMPHLFEPFYTTKERAKGTGMGLSVVHGIMHAHGGHILVDTTPGEGTTFRLLFPYYEKTMPGAVSPASESSRHSDEHTGERILVVDDEAAIVALLKESLSLAGYDVQGEMSSVHALKSLRRNEWDYDLLITDQTMPGVTGLDLVHEALQHYPDLKIVLCSGYSESVDEAAALAAGVSTFMTKPIAQADLLAEVQRLLKN